jgi:3'-phosphoadenosine 5'-phosphosulfate sulfotransferase (PAPS reductase)/FAD synthetase
MDTSDPKIVFDQSGFCNHCTNALKLLLQEPHCFTTNEKRIKLDALIAAIKSEGKNKKYDCIIGVSGGVDSTYVAYIVKKMGLRPLAVHLDNGWDSKLAVTNVENLKICNWPF